MGLVELVLEMKSKDEGDLVEEALAIAEDRTKS